MHTCIKSSMAHCLCRRSVDRSIGILIWGPLGGDPRDFCAAAEPARATRRRQLIAKRILADSSAAASKCGEHNIASGGLTRHAQLCSRSAHLAARLGSQEAGRLPPQPPVPELGREGLGALGRSSGAKPTPWHARVGQGRGPKASPCQATAAAVRLRMSIRSLSGAPRRGSHVAPHRLLGHCPR